MGLCVYWGGGGGSSDLNILYNYRSTMKLYHKNPGVMNLLNIYHSNFLFFNQLIAMVTANILNLGFLSLRDV